MITITFNAFSFLQPKLRSKKINYSNATMTLKDGITLKELIIELGLQLEDVEAAFVNHRVVSMDSILHNNDRVALVPHGTPGPYRVLLNMVKK
jgi:sulfur carrier protein ThiS